MHLAVVRGRNTCQQAAPWRLTILVLTLALGCASNDPAAQVADGFGADGLQIRHFFLQSTCKSPNVDGLCLCKAASDCSANVVDPMPPARMKR